MTLIKTTKREEEEEEEEEEKKGRQKKLFSKEKGLDCVNLVETQNFMRRRRKDEEIHIQ